MAIPDVGVALAAPTPQTPAPAGNKSKAGAPDGRQSFASIVSDLSDDSRPSAGSTNGGASRPAAQVQSEASSERAAQNGRPQSRPGAAKSIKAGAQPEASTDLAMASGDQDTTSSLSIETDAKSGTARRSEARAEGEAGPQVESAADRPVDVPVSAPTTAPGFIAQPTVDDLPKAGDAERGVVGGSSGNRTEGTPVNADGVGTGAFLRAGGLKGGIPSTDTVNARRDLGRAADFTVDSEAAVDATAAGDGEAAAVANEPEMTAGGAGSPVRDGARFSRELAGLASVRQVASTEAVLVARTSIRDALARSVFADSSQADAAQATHSAGTEADEAAQFNTPSRGSDAAGVTVISESGRRPVASGFIPESAGRGVAEASASGAGTSAQFGAALSSREADDARLDVDPSLSSDVDVDAALTLAKGKGAATQGSSTPLTTAAVAAQIRGARVPGASGENPSAAGQSLQAAQTIDSTQDAAHATDGGAAATITTLNPASTMADRGPAPLAAQRAQARYARVSADVQTQAVESAVISANAARAVDALAAGVPSVAVADTPQLVTPQTLTAAVFRNSTSRAIDARQARALSNAGNEVSAPSGAPANTGVTPPSAFAITTAQDARFAETATSEDGGSAPNGHARRSGHSAADAVLDAALLNSPVRQFADAVAMGTSTTSTARSARDASATAPAPVAQRLTGTSAIAIAAFQAVAAAALTTPDTVSSGASSASTRVMDLELPSQIVQLVRLRADNGDGQVHMRLNPDYLGDVSVDVRMNGASVVASVHASSADVRDWLRANEMQLRQTLADQGLHLQELVVADDEPSQRESSGQRHQQPSDEQPQERRARRPRETATFEVLL